MSEANAASRAERTVLVVGRSSAVRTFAGMLGSDDSWGVVHHLDADAPLETLLRRVDSVLCDRAASAPLLARSTSVPVLVVGSPGGSPDVLALGGDDVIGPEAPPALLRARLDRLVEAAVDPKPNGGRTGETTTTGPSTLPDESLGSREESELPSLSDGLFEAIERASTPTDLEEMWCSALTAHPSIALAWIGERTRGDGALEPRAWAGTDAGLSYLRSVSLEDGDGDPEPSARALAMDTAIQVTPSRTDLPHGPTGPWRPLAGRFGIEGVVSVPLPSQGYGTGVLSVYATHELGEEVLERVRPAARAFSHVRSALERSQSLDTPGVVELGLSVSGGTDPLIELARVLDEILVRGWSPPRPESREEDSIADDAGHSSSPTRRTLFLAIPGSVSPHHKIDRIEAISGIADCRIGDARDEWVWLDVTVVGSSLTAAMAISAAVPRRFERGPDEVDAVVDVGHAVNVRGFLHGLDDALDATVTLTSRRNRDRHLGELPSVPGSIEALLTDRQRQVVETAYYGGYFEWPRDRTAEEVAELLDISQPTFARHLRGALDRVFETTLEGDRNHAEAADPSAWSTLGTDE